MPLLDPQPALDVGRNGEVGAEVEKLVLDPLEHGAQLDGHHAGEDDPERGIQLVDGAERLDARVELGDARPVTERRLPRVPTARVDPREAHRLVPRARHGLSLLVSP